MHCYFSTVTVVTRTHHSVMLYVHGQCCSVLMSSRVCRRLATSPSSAQDIPRNAY